MRISDWSSDVCSSELGNGYSRTLLCFIQLFVVSNRDNTVYFANNNARHFSFNAEERYLPVYEYAAPDNRKIKGIDAFADAFLAKCTLGQMISKDRKSTRLNSSH